MKNPEITEAAELFKHQLNLNLKHVGRNKHNEADHLTDCADLVLRRMAEHFRKNNIGGSYSDPKAIEFCEHIDKMWELWGEHVDAFANNASKEKS